MSDRKALFDVIRFIFLLVAIIGVWYLIRNWRRKKAFKQRLPEILSQVRQANNDLNRLTCFERYFANADEQAFLTSYRVTRDAIVRDHVSMGRTANLWLSSLSEVHRKSAIKQCYH